MGYSGPEYIGTRKKYFWPIINGHLSSCRSGSLPAVLDTSKQMTIMGIMSFGWAETAVLSLCRVPYTASLRQRLQIWPMRLPPSVLFQALLL